MPGRSTTEAIHLLRSLMEKYREKQRDLHMAFLDLEKAYDSVPRELVWRTLIDKGTPRRYLRVIRDMYEGRRPVYIPRWGTHESADRLNNKLESWRKVLEDNGLRVSKEKTKYLRCDFGRRVEALSMDDARRRGRPKIRWEDRPKQDMKELLLSEDMTSDRNA
ncbi:retrovirus-related pol polyprotein LINE-1 [Tanacetum coccineum]